MWSRLVHFDKFTLLRKLEWGVKLVEKYFKKIAEDYEEAVRARGYCLPDARINSLVKYAQLDVNDTNVTVLYLGCGVGIGYPGIVPTYYKFEI